MFNKNKLNTHAYLTIFVVALFVAALAIAAYFIAAPSADANLNHCTHGWRIGSAKSVSCHGVCRLVSKSSGPDFFIGTAGSGEWSSFRSRPPQGANVGSCYGGFYPSFSPYPGFYPSFSPCACHCEWVKPSCSTGTPCCD